MTKRFQKRLYNNCKRSCKICRSVQIKQVHKDNIGELCLDHQGSGDGGIPWMWDCDSVGQPTDRNRTWDWQVSTGQLRTSHDQGICLDHTGGPGIVRLRKCVDTRRTGIESNQQWDFDGQQIIARTNGEKKYCLDLDHGREWKKMGLLKTYECVGDGVTTHSHHR